VPQDVPSAFFSYSREDSDFALKLAADLKAAGADVWIDRLDIKPGQWWDKSVEEALNRCPRMLVILSPASVNSKNVLDEVSFALEEQKTVLPILYRDCHIPFRLRRVQYVDFTEDYAEALKRLLDALAARPVPTTDVIQAAMIKEAMAAEESKNKQVPIPPPAGLVPDKQQADDSLRQQASFEQEQQRIAAEQARIDEERKQAAAEKARLDEIERRATEEKSKQAEADRQAIAAEQARLEQERQRLAAEQAHLEEERKQAAAEKARLQQLEQERQIALEKAKQEEKRKAAAEKARREREERERQAAEKARQEAKEHQRAEEQARSERAARERREAEERAWLASAPTTAVAEHPSAPAETQFASEAPENTWIKPVGIGLAVLLVIGLIVLVIWQRSNEAAEREDYARGMAEVQARADRAQKQAEGRQPSTAAPSTQTSAPAGNRPPVEPPPQTATTTSGALATPHANEGALPPRLSNKVAGLYRKAQAGNSDAQVDVGLAYYSGQGAPQDYAEALKWFRKAADAGNPWGMNNVGSMYEDGYGGLQRDAAQAVAWYRKGVDAGNARSMTLLGLMYEYGRGVTKNETLAVQWYRRAADAGDDVGQNNLAWSYATSSDVTIRNPAGALEYAQKAVNAGGANPNPNHLDTLAEAYYVNHRYQEAVDTEHKAISLASQKQKVELQKNLQKYQLALSANNLRQ
jgi:TPR repeat protein